MATGVVSRYIAPAENVEFGFLEAQNIQSCSVEQTMRELGRGAGAPGGEIESSTALLKGMYVFLPSGVLSTVVHVVVLLTGALWLLPPNVDHSAPPLVVTDAEEIEEEEEVFEDEIVLKNEPTEDEKLDKVEIVDKSPASDREVESHFDELAATEVEPTLDALQLDTPLPEIQPIEEMEASHSGGTAFSGRGRLQRAVMVHKEGGSTLTEKAVEESLKWITRHQNQDDGGFSFQHTVANCKCGNPGTHGRNGATGLALLPFLGAGYTHQAGPYKREIGAALSFLARRMKPDSKSKGGSLWEAKGQMYSHGLCAIALAEAYGMTRDSRLRGPTIAALRHIIYAQDPKGGGWRYDVRQPGDTSVVGWQLMALKSGKMAGIEIPPIVFQRANHFLISVSADSGTWYGYAKSEKGRYATTAVGHLSRMYLGVGRDDPSLQRGVAVMDKKGPVFGDMYYNYYASQVMHHYGGAPWERWNQKSRDTLIDRQEKRGHEKGSWMFSGSDHGFRAGGRLYSTAMAAMMLEVYYRHMPLYQDKTAEAELAGWDLE